MPQPYTKEMKAASTVVEAMEARSCVRWVRQGDVQGFDAAYRAALAVIEEFYPPVQAVPAASNALPVAMTIADLCERSYATAQAKGWGTVEDSQWAFPCRMMEVIAVLMNAVEADRKNLLAGDDAVEDAIQLLLKLHGEMCAGDVKHPGPRPFVGRALLMVTELVEAVEAETPENRAEEMADLAIRWADTCKRHEIDIMPAIRAKMVANDLRPYKHGGKKY